LKQILYNKKRLGILKDCFFLNYPDISLLPELKNTQFFVCQIKNSKFLIYQTHEKTIKISHFFTRFFLKSLQKLNNYEKTSNFSINSKQFSIINRKIGTAHTKAHKNHENIGKKHVI
jgi:hypothetical protein